MRRKSLREKVEWRSTHCKWLVNVAAVVVIACLIARFYNWLHDHGLIRFKSWGIWHRDLGELIPNIATTTPETTMTTAIAIAIAIHFRVSQSVADCCFLALFIFSGFWILVWVYYHRQCCRSPSSAFLFRFVSCFSILLLWQYKKTTTTTTTRKLKQVAWARNYKIKDSVAVRHSTIYFCCCCCCSFSLTSIFLHDFSLDCFLSRAGTLPQTDATPPPLTTTTTTPPS